MPATATGWELDVRRGPGWLLVRPLKPGPDLLEELPLAEEIWSLLDRHLIYRLALELDELDVLDSHLVSQLLMLYRRLQEHGGQIRICGLSPFNQRVLQTHGLVDRFPAYDDLEDAMMSACPRAHRVVPR